MPDQANQPADKSVRRESAYITLPDERRFRVEKDFNRPTGALLGEKIYHFGTNDLVSTEELQQEAGRIVHLTLRDLILSAPAEHVPF